MDNISNRAVIRYLGLQGLTPKEIHEDMVVTLGEDAPLYSMVKKWAAEFKRSRERLEDDPRPGRPMTVSTQDTIAKIHEIIMADRRVMERYIGYLPGRRPCSYPQRNSNVQETKQQSKQWNHSGSPPPKKAKTVIMMASFFWDAEGVLVVDYLDKALVDTLTLVTPSMQLH
ncbi:uncharacterized protein LOC121366396 [Gigantopelta aegis]|uniref:uncharacterized protein LOC121366396 n=1 Tax=Gigantopelta aegis TaxID=1735272 RepID=UPI001B88DD0B|nr:uncharacterized protein LOC121366396 [Gigantopelta aegis]